jgi:hypothetical protein
MALSAQDMSLPVFRLLCTALLACQVGCRKAPAPAAPTPSVSISAQNDLLRGDRLLKVLSLSHQEVAARLGAHRIESKTRWTITPIPSPRAAQVQPVAPGFRLGQPAQPFSGEDAYEVAPVSMEETRFIELDGSGRLHIGNENDHGTGMEAVTDDQHFFSKMRYQPFIRYRAEGSQVERLRTIGFDTGASLLETVGHRLKLGTPSSVDTKGRPSWNVTLRMADSASVPIHSQGSAWRGAVSVESIEGSATVDREQGVPLAVELTVRFVAPRPGVPDERVQVEATHVMQVVALGSEAVKVQVPSEFSEPPTRPRPWLERQELLGGLVPSFR